MRGWQSGRHQSELNQLRWMDNTHPPYYGIIKTMNKYDGRIKKGEHKSPDTEFKKGEHWRPPKPYWDHDWLENEYKSKSADEIAREWGVTGAAICFWMRKHKIKRRSTQETRSKKYWGSKGEMNGMHGKTGLKNPNWQGGITLERQSLYSSLEWSDAVKAVWKRDNGVCQRCGKTKNEKEIHIHHIISFAVKEYRADANNLVSLCDDCHWFVHSKQNVNKEFIKEGGAE